jgi:hypothetical protein
MKIQTHILRLCLLFICLLLLITAFDTIYEAAPFRAVVRLPAEIRTKELVDFIKDTITTSMTLEERDQLLIGREEILTTEVGWRLFNTTEPSRDMWGVPVVITAAHSGTSLESTEFGVYSKGPDGVSRSSGNDPDDISSWATVDNPYWRRVHRYAFVKRWTRRCAWTATFCVIISIALSLYNRRKSQHSRNS